TPRFAFEKFPAARPVLGTQMKSVGEAMAIGRTFREALGKAIRSLETGRYGFDLPLRAEQDDVDELARAMTVPNPDRLYQLARAFQLGMSAEQAHALTHIDPWFLDQVQSMALAERDVAEAAAAHGATLERALGPRLRQLKRMGMSDRRIAALAGGEVTED